MNQKGAVPALLLLVVIGIISFFFITNIFSFKNQLFSNLFPKPRTQALTLPDLTSTAWTILENRVDLTDDGVWDSYWVNSASSGTCTISLYNLSDKSLRWSTDISNCTGMPFPPIFHKRSFMGDSTKDFTIVVQQPPTIPGDLGYNLFAGDGASGQFRNFSFRMGNAAIAAVLRLKGIATVDFKIASYPGVSLLVRTTGGGNDQKGHLFYFPSSDNGYKELTQDSSVINSSIFQNYPFPGVDIPNDLYTSIYNNFNFDLYACEKISEVPQINCGIPDDNSGQGFFLDQLAVGDLDADGADDALMTYLWREVVYPGRPKGRADFLGAPQYDNYYNPQNDSSVCHSGRHYGLSALTNIDDDPYLETVDIAGNTVDAFNDPYQNVSRNVAVVDTFADLSLPTFRRRLLWNNPMNTTIPNCNMTMMYHNSLHYAGDGLIKDNGGKLKYINFNRWTQTSPSTICDHSDIPCHNQILSTQTGHWSWQVLDAKNGGGVQAIDNIYVWDLIPDPSSGNFWILYSNKADTWNLGYTTIGSPTQSLRDDLTIGLVDLQTLAISNLQGIGLQAKPFLKAIPWQLYSLSTASTWYANRLFTIQTDIAQTPDFVVRIAGGLALFTLQNNIWSLKAQYDTYGNLISPTPTSTPSPTPSATSSPSPTPAPKVGDINGDGFVNVVDFSILLSKWNTPDTSADLNKDGIVNVVDFSILLSNWGS